MTHPPKRMTKEIATLNWKAPEVILDNLSYSYAVDMWSVGVVIYEMLTGTLPFKGTTEIEYLLAIFRKKGYPADTKHHFFKNSPVLKLMFAKLPGLRGSGSLKCCQTESNRGAYKEETKKQSSYDEEGCRCEKL